MTSSSSQRLGDVLRGLAERCQPDAVVPVDNYDHSAPSIETLPPGERIALLAPTLFWTSPPADPGLSSVHKKRKLDKESSTPPSKAAQDEAASDKLEVTQDKADGSGGVKATPGPADTLSATGHDPDGEAKDPELPQPEHKASATDTHEKSSWQAGELQRYHRLLQNEKDDMERLEKTRKRILQEQVDLWGVYQHGLTRIASLNDLSHAPDAILPGNFPA